MNIQNIDFESEKYSITEIASVIDLCTSQEKLDSIITETEDLSVLELTLRLKLFYVARRNVDIKIETLKMFELITDDNCDMLCKVISTALLIEASDSTLKSFLVRLKNWYYNNEENTRILEKLLHVAIGVCEALNKLETFFKIIDEIFITDLYLKVNGEDWKTSRNYFNTNIMVKYVKLAKNSRNLMTIVLFNEDLLTLSCLFDSFTSLDDCGLLSNFNFWFFLQSNLLNNVYSNKKITIHILKKCIKFISTTETKLQSQLVIVHNHLYERHDFIKLWNSFFILLEILNEQQLHLTSQSLVLLNSVTNLHSMWLFCLYKLMLTHTQNSIAFDGISHVLRSKLCKEIEFFQPLIKYLLIALNKIEYSKNYQDILRNLKLFAKECGDDIFTVLMEESLNVIWVPTAMWCFYSSILSSNKSVAAPVIEALMCKIKNVPHKYIRDGCFIILVDFMCNGMIPSFVNFLRVAVGVVDSNKKYFQKYLCLTDRHVELYKKNDAILTEITKWEKEDFISASKIHVIIKLVENDEVMLQKIFLLVKYKKLAAQVSDNVVVNLCNSFLSSKDIIDYLDERIDDINITDSIALYKIIHYIKCDVDNTKLMEKCTYIVLNPKKYEPQETRFAFTIYCLSRQANFNVVTNFLIANRKINPNICNSFLHMYRKLDITQDICEILENIFEMQTEDVVAIIFKYLSCITHRFQNREKVFKFLNQCYDELLKFKNTKLFKTCLNYYLTCIFQDFYENEKFLLQMTDKLNILCRENELAALVLAVSLESNSKRMNIEIFTPIIVELLLHGKVYKKGRKVEYEICKEISQLMNENNESNPAYQEIIIRSSAVAALLNMLQIAGDDDHRKVIADTVTSMLLEKYKTHYNKRYFADSLVHLQKLRTMQTLLLIHKYISVQHRSLIKLLMNSFCDENHQPSVKQLMQWLMIRLIRDQENCIEEISEKVTHASHAHTSTIVAFIPVLFHISSGGTVEFIEKIIKILLPWTIGPHFKLRLYSQIAIIKLNSYLKQICPTVVGKYNSIIGAIETVIRPSDKEVQRSLQSDIDFFDHFDPDKHFSIESIYIDIPRLNGVTSTEWEFINLEDIPGNDCINVNADLKFSFYEKYVDSKQFDVDGDEFGSNIQKKIVPWKDTMQTEDENGGEKVTGNLILVASLIESPANLGGLSRTCEIYGVKQMIVGDRKIINNKEFKSLSMSSENWVNIIEVKTLELRDYLRDARHRGYFIIGAEQTSESVHLNRYHFPFKSVLVLGNEKEGISPSVLALLDVCIEIPQFGVVRSLNVHVAGATFIWEYVKQHVIN